MYFYTPESVYKLSGVFIFLMFALALKWSNGFPMDSGLLFSSSYLEVDCPIKFLFQIE